MNATLVKTRPGTYELLTDDRVVRCCLCLGELRSLRDEGTSTAFGYPDVLLWVPPARIRAMIAGMCEGDALQITDYGTDHADVRWE
jgi:hypothetical protein